MNVGETIFSAVLQALFQLLLSPDVINGFFSLFGGSNLPETIKDCQFQLLFLDKFLRDAEKKQFVDEFIKKWLAELQDIAYDLEDILDELATDAQLYNLKKKALALEDDVHQLTKDFPNVFASSSNNMVTKIFGSTRAAESLSTLFNSDPSFQSRLDGIIERLQRTQTLAQLYGLSPVHGMQQQTLQTETSESWRESTSLLSQPVVYGRDKKKDEIITQLLKDEQINENFAVIPIVGKGGIGKTTLAQYVYNDEQVNSHFDCKAWMCVSDVFDVKGITTTIFKAVNPGAVANFSSLNEAQENLKQVLTGRKFLIVLDDVWELKYGEWDTLQAPFQYGAKGSRVIMTTRVLKSARTMIGDPIHTTIIDLPVLSDDDCWCLFQQHAKGVSGLVEKPDIIEKCKGLPLVAKALGGLLKSAGDKIKCQMILNSNIWREESSVLPVLRLSYDHLPSNLKRVFAYCSVYPKDHLFEERELVLSWMAQGFLPGNQSERMEDVGHTYFFDLVSRSLFEKRYSFIGGKVFIMHDLIHDLAQWAAGDTCWVPEDMQRDRGRTRHLFLSKHCIDETLGNQLLAPQLLRTFIAPQYLFNDCLDAKLLDYIQKLKYVRTLKLALEEIEELPDLFGGLIHLRCLTLSITKIKVLPKSISKLCNLQTLELNGCPKLKKIPNMSFLVKLRHLKIGYRSSLKEMPLGIGKLTNLQTLDKFILAARGGSKLRKLKNLNHLHGSLEIVGLGNGMKVEDAQEAQLHKKTSLEELYLNWVDYYLYDMDDDMADDNTARDVVEQLQPPSSIKKCVLSGYKGLTFPCWLGDPSFKNMVHIRLRDCQKCESLPPLGQLPKLEILYIEGMRGIKQVDLEFYGSCPTPFQALKSLEFRWMDSWERWVHSPGDKNSAFSCLEKLEISNCKSLQGSIPPHLPSLKELIIETCMEMSVSLPSLLSPKNLIIKGCKELSIMGDVISCPGDVQFNRKFGNQLFIENWHSLINWTTLANFTQFCSIKKLRVRDCQSLITCELATCTQPSSLKLLQFSRCENMESLPSQLHNFSSLKKLVIHDCPKIQCFPEGGLPKNLTRLIIHKMKIEQPVQEWGLHLCNSLQFLQLMNVGSSANIVEHIPCPGFSLPSSLITFEIENFQNLKTISSHSTLPNLTELRVRNCLNLEFLFVDHVVFASLTKLELENCPNFRFFPIGCLFKNLMLVLEYVGSSPDTIEGTTDLHLPSSLQSLEDVGSSPDTIKGTTDLHLPSSLQSLFIRGLKNLKTIHCSNLPKLTRVQIEFCPKFESFGDNGLPSQLERVYIKGCDILQQKLRSDPQGRIWIDYKKGYSLC